jgi:hypothetical protein
MADGWKAVWVVYEVKKKGGKLHCLLPCQKEFFFIFIMKYEVHT